MSDDSKNEKIGYGRPPRHTRFKPGQSGNPRGRPKSADQANDLFARVLGKRVPVVEGGKRRHTTKSEVLLTRTLNEAVNGSSTALKNLIMLLRHKKLLTEAETLSASTAHPRKIEVQFVFPEQARWKAGQLTISDEHGNVTVSDGINDPKPSMLEGLKRRKQ